MDLTLIWTLATGVLFLGLAWRTRRFANALVSLKELPVRMEPPTGRSKWPRVSLVIPACNEADTIEPAAKSLLEINYPNLEIVLVNDRSKDGTGAIIDRLAGQDPRIKAMHIHELPEGWLGKVHALEKGMALTTGEWILLTDADVFFTPEALKKAINLCVQDQLDFLTVIPDVVARGKALQVMMAQLFHQASLFFNPRKINDPKHKACYGQGAFNLLRRTTYERSEKMQWLRMEVVDDTGLALLMRRAGAKLGVVVGLGEIKIEWYPSLGTFLKGLEKNGFAFCQYSFSVLLGFIACDLVILSGFTWAPLHTHNPWAMAFCWTSLVVYLRAIYAQLRVIQRIRFTTVFFFPISFVLLGGILLRAAILTFVRGGINWRGTFYSLKELKANQRMKLANLVFTPGDTPALQPRSAPGVHELLVKPEDLEMIDQALTRLAVHWETVDHP